MTLRSESRGEFSTNDGSPDHAELKLGCLQRIADATEAMAKRHNDLIQNHKWQKDRADRYWGCLETERRRSAALRGHTGRLKRKIAEMEGETDEPTG